mmetsp:Transcript_9989/g.37752  ORF Transcript_9989/g.37752 Transcript_9989/m.37752 type:complete len:406 (+) Transcript_9989:49-1266(+)|eukprot:scaffold501_cov355-Pinguiococcus_pyrenoidosus.AAC.7
MLCRMDCSRCQNLAQDAVRVVPGASSRAHLHGAEPAQRHHQRVERVPVHLDILPQLIRRDVGLPLQWRQEQVIQLPGEVAVAQLCQDRFGLADLSCVFRDVGRPHAPVRCWPDRQILASLHTPVLDLTHVRDQLLQRVQQTHPFDIVPRQPFLHAGTGMGLPFPLALSGRHMPPLPHRSWLHQHPGIARHDTGREGDGGAAVGIHNGFGSAIFDLCGRFPLYEALLPRGRRVSRPFASAQTSFSPTALVTGPSSTRLRLGAVSTLPTAPASKPHFANLDLHDGGADPGDDPAWVLRFALFRCGWLDQLPERRGLAALGVFKQLLLPNATHSDWGFPRIFGKVFVRLEFPLSNEKRVLGLLCHIEISQKMDGLLADSPVPFAALVLRLAQTCVRETYHVPGSEPLR